MKKKEILWQKRVENIRRARVRYKIMVAYNTLVQDLIKSDRELERLSCGETEKILKRAIQEEAWKLLFHKDFIDNFPSYSVEN